MEPKQIQDPRMTDVFRRIEDKAELESILGKANLSEESLEFLELRYTDDLTLKEIAGKMGKTENQVNALDQKTKEKLRRANLDLNRI